MCAGCLSLCAKRGASDCDWLDRVAVTRRSDRLGVKPSYSTASTFPGPCGRARRGGGRIESGRPFTPNVLSSSEARDRLDRFFWGRVISAPQLDLMLTLGELCGGIQQLRLGERL